MLTCMLFVFVLYNTDGHGKPMMLLMFSHSNPPYLILSLTYVWYLFSPNLSVLFCENLIQCERIKQCLKSILLLKYLYFNIGFWKLNVSKNAYWLMCILYTCISCLIYFLFGLLELSFVLLLFIGDAVFISLFLVVTWLFSFLSLPLVVFRYQLQAKLIAIGRKSELSEKWN